MSLVIRAGEEKNVWIAVKLCKSVVAFLWDSTKVYIDKFTGEKLFHIKITSYKVVKLLLVFSAFIKLGVNFKRFSSKSIELRRNKLDIFFDTTVADSEFLCLVKFECQSG